MATQECISHDELISLGVEARYLDAGINPVQHYNRKMKKEYTYLAMLSMEQIVKENRCAHDSDSYRIHLKNKLKQRKAKENK
jgi:hypothetical protein